MLATVNAIGNAIPPFMVFPKVHFKDLMVHGAPPGTVGTAHVSDWMTADSFYLFMKHIITSTKYSNEQPVLLILGNHETHLSIKTIDLVKKKGVVMMTLPPHYSNKLQPLDRTVYGPYESFCNYAANSFIVNNPGKPIAIRDISILVVIASPLAFTPKNIESGFRCTVIFRDKDFLSSYFTNCPIEQCLFQIQKTPSYHNLEISTSNFKKFIMPGSSTSKLSS